MKSKSIQVIFLIRNKLITLLRNKLLIIINQINFKGMHITNSALK